MRDQNWRQTPRDYQWDAYLAQRDKLNYGLWWDQGLGKSCETLAQCAHMHRQGKVNALFIIAPPGVETNWTFDEIPKWWPEDIPTVSKAWSSAKSKTKKWMTGYAEFLKADGFKILTMSYNAMMTERGAKAARKFLDDHDVFYVVDEGSYIKTPSAKTTMRVVASSKYAKVRRLLNGTPVEDSPFAAYSQVKWIDPSIWERRGIGNYAQFKTMFGIFETMQLKNGRSFPQLKHYRNLDLLTECLYEAGQRLLKEDVAKDLPPKTFTKVYFDLSSKARKLYRDLKDHYTTTTEAGEVIDAELAIVRMTRFQQITSGYFPKEEDGDDLEPIEEKNPRIALLRQVIEGTVGQAIIWAKYIPDVEAIQQLLTDMKETHGCYIGSTSPDDREQLKRDFQAGKVRFFIANKSAARGLTLTAAKTVIFYNNLFSADVRKQQEDRAHRIGQDQPVLYVDLVARDSVDQHILAVLRRKKAMACTVTGDQMTEWI